MKPYLSFPSPQQLSQLYDLQQSSSFSYQELGGTKLKRVPGYDNDHNFRIISSGAKEWEKAKHALQQWQHFPSGWTKTFPADVPVQEGQHLLVLFHLFGLWWVNANRILYTFDEPHRFGFTYGTLERHVERGEESFWIEQNAAGAIEYHIKAFSRPQFWGAKLTYPLARKYQRRFVRQSMQRMADLVS